LLLWSCLTLLACGRDSNTPVGTPIGADGGPASDGGTPTPVAAKPEILTLSRTGHDRFYGVTYAPSGALYAVGQVTNSTETDADISLLVAKFTAAGEFDPRFGSRGVVTRNVSPGRNGEIFRSLVVQSSGKIVVAGTAEHLGRADARDRDIEVQRFNSDGTVDDTFGANGTWRIDLSIGAVNGAGFSSDSAWGLLRYDDDRLLINGSMVRNGGVDTDFVLLRLTPEGAPDPTFGLSGGFALDTQVDGMSNDASPRNVTLLPNAAGLIGVGVQPLPGGGTGPVVYKVSDAGVLDTSFGDNGVFSQSPLEQFELDTAAVQPTADGGYKLVLIGSGREQASDTTDLVSLRLTSDGVIDPSYGKDGLVRVDIGGFDDQAQELRMLPDGRILIVGGARRSTSDWDGLVMILSADGAPDESFAPGGFRTFDLGGPADFFWGLALSKDASTAAIAGFKGVGNAPPSASDNDDAALLLLPLSR
jgi:uncharacterized delta-60 repeat protein